MPIKITLSIVAILAAIDFLALQLRLVTFKTWAITTVVLVTIAGLAILIKFVTSLVKDLTNESSKSDTSEDDDDLAKILTDATNESKVVEALEKISARFLNSTRETKEAINEEIKNLIEQEKLLWRKELLMKKREQLETEINKQQNSNIPQSDFLNWNYLMFIGYFVITFIASIFLAIILNKGLSLINFKINSLMLIPLIFSAFVGYLAFNCVGAVPSGYIWLLEVFNKYVKTLNPGPRLIFPWFTAAKEIDIRIKQENLFKDGGEDGGKIDFKDAASNVTGYFLYKIVDPVKFEYNVGNTVKTLRDKLDEATRSFLAQKGLEEAIELMPTLTLKTILNGKTNSEYATVEENPVFQDITKDWGIEVTEIMIVDIALPKELEDIRDLILKKTKNIELAVKDAKLAIKEKNPAITRKKIKAEEKLIEAEATKKTLILEGEGHSTAIEEIIGKKVDPNIAAYFFVDNNRWDKLSPQAATVITDGSSGASLGAGIGVGISTASKPKDPEEKKDSEPKDSEPKKKNRKTTVTV